MLTERVDILVLMAESEKQGKHPSVERNMACSGLGASERFSGSVQ